MVWRGTPALRGGGFELPLHNNWIKREWGGCCCEAPGPLGRCNRRQQFVPMLSSTCGAGSGQFCSCFPVIPSPGDRVRRVKCQSCLTSPQACSANGAATASGAAFVLSRDLCYSTYLCTHRLSLVCAQTRDQTYNLGALGPCSNQLSYLARARLWDFCFVYFIDNFLVA